MAKKSVSEFVNSLHVTEIRHNMRGGRGSEAALVLQHRGRMQPGVPIDRLATTSETSRQVAGSTKQQLQGTRQQ